MMINILIFVALVSSLEAKEQVPAGTIIACRLERPQTKGDWIHYQAVAQRDFSYHNHIVVHEGEVVARIAIRKGLEPALNGGELVAASRHEIRLSSGRGYQEGQIISVLFEQRTMLN